MTQVLRGKVAIAGVGTFGMGTTPEWTAMEMAQRAALIALDDAGLSLEQVDGLCAGSLHHFFPTLSAAEQLGIYPKWSNADSAGGSSFLSHVMQAAAAMHAGLCENVLIVYGSVARSSRDLNGIIETPDREQPWEPLVPLSGYALAASRYLHQYGLTREALGHVHLSARKWAMLNPDAELREPISMEEYLGARQIATPFSRYDCCLLSDGAAAIVLTKADLARDLRKPPVYVLGAGAAHWHREIAQMPDLTVTAATESSARAYETAGIGPQDIDVIQVYDAFTLNVLLFLEDLGFAKKGDAAHLVASGAISPGGSMPVNTDGGGLCCVHPGMYGLFCIIEAVRQLRGEAGQRQIVNAETAVAHGNGGTLSHQATLVLGAASTL